MTIYLSSTFLFVLTHMSYLEHETLKWKGCHLDKKHVINEGIIWDFESVESSIDQLKIWVACSLKVEIQASLVVANNLTSKMYLPSIVKILIMLQKHQKHKSYTFYFIINYARVRFISKLSHTCEMTQTQLPKTYTNM